MGQQNEPRWGLFKTGGSAGPAFLKLLEDLDNDGIIERQYGQVATFSSAPLSASTDTMSLCPPAAANTATVKL